MPRPKRIQSSGTGLGRSSVGYLGPYRGPASRSSGSNGRSRTPGRGLMDPQLTAALEQIAKKTPSKGGGGALDGLFNGGKKVFGGVLDALDTPRAAILSLGNEVGGALEGEGFSPADLLKNTRDNYAFNDFLGEHATQTDSWNPLVKFGVGLAADIAIDPLTYLSGGATAAESGAKGISEALLRSASDDALQAGLRGEELVKAVGASEKGIAAARVAKTRSAGHLSDELRRAAGMVDDAGVVERGMYLNAPGTGRIGRRLHIDQAIDAVTRGRYGLSRGERLAAKQISLSKAQGLSKLHETVMRPVAYGANKLTTSARAVNGSEAAFKAMFRSGDPEEAVKGFHGLETAARGRYQEKRLDQETMHVMNELFHDAHKAGVDTVDLHAAVQGDGPAIERILKRAGGKEILERGQAFFPDLGITANERVVSFGGKPLVKINENYAPRILTDEAREARKAAGSMPAKGKKAFLEKARRLKAGEDLMGTTLLDPAAHPDNWSIEHQIEQILADNNVDHRLFSDDAKDVWPQYVRALSRRVGNEVTAGQLIERGLGEYAYGFTAKGQKVVDARAQAFKMKEAARRAARMAEGRLGDAAARFSTGVTDARKSGLAAKANTADAKRAADEALAAVDTPHAGAEAMREYADHLESLGVAEAAQRSRFMERAINEIDVTSTEALMAKAEAIAARDVRDGLAQKIRGIRAERDRLWGEVSDLWDQHADRMAAGKATEKIEAQIAAKETEIAEVHDLLDEVGVVAAPRPAEAIAVDRQQIVSLQKQLGGRLRQAERAGDPVRIAQVRADIDTAREWADALKYEAATGKIIDGEARQMLAEGQDELTRLGGHLADLQAKAEALGNDALAQELAALQARLPVWDEATQTIRPPDGIPFDHWWHGGQGGDMLGFTPSGGGHIDNSIGMHMTSERNVAEGYAYGRGTGGGSVAGFDLAAAPDQIHTYETPYDIMEMMAPNDTQFDRANKFGAPWGPTKAAMLDDSISQAIRDGIVDTDHVMDALGAGGLDADDYDQLWDVVDEIVDDVRHGASLSETLSAQFTGTDLDVFANSDVVNRYGEPFEGHWNRVGNYLIHSLQEEGEGFSSAMKRDIGLNYRKHLMDQGKKAIFYDHGYGGQELVLLDPTIARAAEGIPQPFKTAQDVERQIQDHILTETNKAQDELTKAIEHQDALDVDARLDYEGAAKRAIDNERQARLIEKRLASLQGAHNERVRNSLEAEAGFRAAAADARRQGDVLQQAYMAEQQAKAAALGQAYDARVIDEDRLAVHNGRLVSNLEADYQQALADHTKWQRVAKRRDVDWHALQDTHAEMAVQTAVDRGLKMFGASTLLPEDMTEVLTAATRLREPGFLRKALGAFDYVQNLWKGYATMTPGFIGRNVLGGVFNNALAGVERSVYKDYFLASAGKARGIWQEGFDAAVEAGIHTGGQSIGEVMVKTGHLGPAARLNPFHAEFGPIAAVRKGSAGAENMLRTSLFMDVYAKTGGNVDAAISAVNKYHFDYDDLSAVERSVLRRVIPFYTWTRKNLPLQLEMIARNPKVYNRYTQAKQNMEALSSQESSVPGYFGDNFAIRLPWNNQGGNMYYMPDLPFTNMMEMVNPKQAIANTSPFIKTPIELWAGKQFWNDIPFNNKYVPVSPVVEKIPGLMPALEAAGWATTNASGQWVMKDRHMYAMGSFLPTLAQARRLAPGDEKYQQRVLTSWLSFFGAGLRSNTTAEKQSQSWIRYYDLQRQLATLQDLGFVDKSASLNARAKYGDTPGDPTQAMQAMLEDYEWLAEDEERNSLSG